MFFLCHVVILIEISIYTRLTVTSWVIFRKNMNKHNNGIILHLCCSLLYSNFYGNICPHLLRLLIYSHLCACDAVFTDISSLSIWLEIVFEITLYCGLFFG